MDLGLSDFVEKEKTPDDFEFVIYAFWEAGHSREEFESAPIPYILSMFRVRRYYESTRTK